MKAQTLYPETKTFWRRPIVADNGWLWLPGPVAEMRMSLSGSAPIAVRPRFRVVDARGEFIGVTEWPSEALDLSGSQIVDGRLLTMVWDEEAEEIVPTVYRIRAAVEGLVYP